MDSLPPSLPIGFLQSTPSILKALAKLWMPPKEVYIECGRVTCDHCPTVLDLFKSPVQDDYAPSRNPTWTMKAWKNGLLEDSFLRTIAFCLFQLPQLPY